MPAAVKDQRPRGIGAAARELRMGEAWVRVLCDRGVLRSVRDTAGRRLIAAESIQEFIAERERQKTGKSVTK